MWTSNYFLAVLFLFLATIIKTKADPSACERREKHLAALDMAKETISIAKDLQPACYNGSKDNSSDSSTCGAKERVAGYLDVAMDLIEQAKHNYTLCDDVATNITKDVILHEEPVDCSEVLENGKNVSGVYTVWPKNRISDGGQLKVYCDMDTDGGGWTVLQRRGPFSTLTDFYRNWADYKVGFGNISEEFWIGNDNIFVLTNQKDYTVRFDMENIQKENRFAAYSSFWIEDENHGYKLHFGNYFGTAGDGIAKTNNMEFSTRDKIYEKANRVCPSERQCGWWFEGCGFSTPNGINRPGGSNDRKYMNWHPWTKYDSLLKIDIKIRPGK